MSRTAPIPGRIEETHVPYQLISPPKEFFRQFANLAHNRVLTEDFPHEKHLTLKYKGTGTNFIVNAKGSLNINTDSVGKEETTADGKKTTVYTMMDTYKTSSEFKLLTGYNRTSTETRFSKGKVKAWTNWGTYNIGEPVEIITGLKGDTCFKQSKAWVTGFYSRGSIGSGTRFQVRREGAKKGEKGEKEPEYIFSIAEKLAYSNKDFWAGTYVDLNLTDLKVSQFNTILGYHINKNIHFYAEHATCKPCLKPPTGDKQIETVITKTEKHVVTEGVNGPKGETTTVTISAKKEEVVPLLKKIGFGKGTFTGVYKDANVHALAQLGWEEPTETFTFEAGAVYTINGDSSVRAKVNKDLDLAIGGRHRLNKNISLVLGTSIPLMNADKFYSAGKTVPIPFGTVVEFNF